MLQYLWQEWQIGNRPVVFQAAGIKTGLFFNRGVTRACLKQLTLWYNTRRQRLIHDTGHYGNNFVQTIIKDRGGYGVKVTRLFGHFLDYCFYKIFTYSLKLCKDSAREFDWVSGDWSVWVKVVSDLVNPMYNEFIKRIRKRLREIFEGSIVSPNLPIIWLLRQRAPENYHSLQSYGKDNLS